MASTKDYLDFILEQLSELDEISYRAMMGEYVLYYRGKVFGGIYDDRFLNLIREFDSSNKYIASICVGALPVAASGVLKGRKATTYHLGDGRRQKQWDFHFNLKGKASFNPVHCL